MATTQEAILVELFGILLVLFGGFNAVAETFVFADWDLLGDMTTWMVAGVVVGAVGLVVGLRSAE